ncbi:hypothetical protein BDA99DRAFT_541134 [Phascolomyces articulosus]|uniref:Uncharacterized protein n=1 Tax=Phascolomyces articulosus TaxID=60185 RepID=A0AAD5K2P6_9FUNG|nr:hypothetical protein BDA99DRAFT_541134 [Phascolomyces articulosus]
MNFQGRSPPVPVASTSTDTVQSQQSTTWGGGSNEFFMKKIEYIKLTPEEKKIVQLFRPGIVLGDPSYRRISLSALEYMKDVKEQIIDDIKNQPPYAIEPPDTDAEQINNISHIMDENQQLVPRLKIAVEFHYRANPYGEDSAGTSPTDSAGNNPDPISNYNELFLLASGLHPRKVVVSKLKEFDLEPLFDDICRIESKPSVFTRLQDVMLFIRQLEPPEPPQRSGTNVTSKASSPVPSPPTSSSSRRFSIPLRRRKMEESNISANELSDHHRQRLLAWERNLIWFIHTANILMGTFHGHLPYYWLNQEQLNRGWKDVPNVRKLPRVPTLEEFDRSRYSISAFPRIKYGIKVFGKEVSLQVLSLMDFRYRIEDKAKVENHTIWKYYSDSILKLSKLIPNKRSFDVAIDVGMIPEDMQSIVDFSWWTDNVIKFGREVEHSMPLSGEGGITIGRETYELFYKLNKGYYSFFKTVRRDLWEQYKYNPVQLILNFITFLLTLAGVVFAVTGVIQVLQGFCYFGDEYCS